MSPHPRDRPDDQPGRPAEPFDPWTAALGHDDLLVALHPVARLMGGGFHVRRGPISVIVLDPDLDGPHRRAVLTHELVHHERGGAVERPGIPTTLEVLVGREERRVDREATDRLVPTGRAGPARLPRRRRAVPRRRRGGRPLRRAPRCWRARPSSAWRPPAPVRPPGLPGRARRLGPATIEPPPEASHERQHRSRPSTRCAAPGRPGGVELRTVPAPEPGPGAAVVEVAGGVAQPGRGAGPGRRGRRLAPGMGPGRHRGAGRRRTAAGRARARGWSA